MATKIEEIRGLNDPQRTYKWRVFLPNFTLPSLRSKLDQFSGQLPGLNGKPFSNSSVINSQTEALAGGIKQKLDQAAQFFNPSIQVEEVQGFPFPNIDKEAFYEGGRNTYFPSLEDVPSFSITFYQDASNKIPNYIMQWKRRIVNQDGTKNLPSNYKFPINLQLLNGQNKVTLDVTARGCFPTQTDGYNLNNQSENLKLTQEFSVDRIHYNEIFYVRAAVKQNIEDKLSTKAADILNRESSFTFLN